MKHIHCFLLMCCCVALNAQNLSSTYTISVANITVGTLTATKTIDGDKTTYTIDSESIIHLLGETTITTSFVGVFINGVLESSAYTSEKDGHPYDSSFISESNGVYTISRKGKETTLTNPIKYVTCMLYFEKPMSEQQYFDVLEAVYSPIESINSNTFVYTDSSNNEKTTYMYVNTILEKGTTNHTLYNFTFSLKK